jgi:hypothetical protein
MSENLSQSDSREKAEKLFWSRVEVQGECWVLRDGAHFRMTWCHGGEQFWRSVRTHAFEIQGLEAPILKGRQLRPDCGNVRCVLPAHQVLTRANDARAVIRQRWARHLKYSTSLRELAREFGVSPQRIFQMIEGVKPEESDV